MAHFSHMSGPVFAISHDFIPPPKGAEAGVRAALEKSDWALFGEMLKVQPATFVAKPEVAKEDWSRIVVLTNMFTQEAIGSSGDAKRYIASIEEEVMSNANRVR